MIRILLAEDHAVIRKGMLQILTQAYPQAEIKEIAEGEVWTERLGDSPWDIVITGLPGLGGHGQDAFQRIREDHPALPILLLNHYTHEPYGYRSLRAGTTGVLGKDAAADELIWAVGQALSGKKYLDIPSKNN